MVLRSLFNLILSAALVAFAAAPLAADELRAAVDRFLTTGAKASPENFEQAAMQYRQLRAKAPGDERVEYACAMVLLNQRRYANALPLLTRQVAQHPADLETRCWHVWTLVQCRRYREALTALEALGARLADPTLAAGDDARQRGVTMLGKLVGYFERVRPGNVSADDVLNVKNKLLASLPEDQIRVLDEGTALTGVKFDELDAARQQRLADRAASAVAARDQVAESFELQASQAAHSETERDAKAGESKDAARQLSLIQIQVARLTQDRSLVAAQMLTVQAMLLELNRTVDVGTTGTGTVATRFQRQTVSIEDVARAQQLSLQLAALNKQAFDMDRKLLQYGREAEGLRVVGAAQGDAAIRNENLRQEAARRAESLDKRLRQLEREKPAPAPALTAQMRSLSTYLPFDYEGERARVLGWFSDSP